jgi:hypothetical protein
MGVAVLCKPCRDALDDPSLLEQSHMFADEGDVPERVAGGQRWRSFTA